MTKPTEEMNVLLTTSLFSNKIVYLEGNALHPGDIKRSLPSHANCVVVLSDQLNKNSVLNDYKNILDALAIKNYVRNMSQKSIRVCL
jgi:hypothetical protein